MQQSHGRMKGLIHVGLSWQRAVAQEWEDAALWAEAWKHAWPLAAGLAA